MAIREFDFEKEPTVSVVKKILLDALKMRATDVHFDPRENDLLIKFRMNGELSEYTTTPDSVKANILTRVKILAGMNITNSVLPQTGVINVDIDGKTHNMRVSTLPIVDGEKIVVHISNYAKNLKSIDRIGMELEDIEKIKSLLKEKQGVILVTGSTASGKTTTTYSLLKELNNIETNIITIEDPVKMRIEGVNQVQIAPEKGINHKTVLRNILLQDPNVIAINELIDDETTRSAFRLSTSGRLIISTLNTKTAFQTVETLLNMDVENYLIGDNLLGIISQRLVKKLCPNCRNKKEASDYEKKIIKEITGQEVKEIYYPEGCEECKNGYIGQSPITEVIKVTPELRDAISNNRNHTLIRNIIYADNDTILKDGLKKVISGETSFSEIIRVMDIKTDFSLEEEKLKRFILGEKIDEDEISKVKFESEEIHPIVVKNDEEKAESTEEDKKEEAPTEPVKETIKLPANLEQNEKSLLEKTVEDMNNDIKKKKEESEPKETKDTPTEEVVTEKAPEQTENEKSLFNRLVNDDSEDDDDSFNYGDSYNII